VKETSIDSSVEIKNPTLFVWIGRTLIVIATMGVMVGYRRFTKLEFGPFYTLEVLFLSWAACVSLTPFYRSLVEFCRLSKPTLLFTAWGVGLLCCDLVISRSSGTMSLFPRIAQHALTILYPVMWTWVGYWCFTTGPRFTRRLVIALFVANVLPNFFGENVTNIAVGPLLSLSFIGVLHRFRWDAYHGYLKAGQILLVLGLALFTFLPFWLTWATDVQRTSLLILFNTFIFVPLILKSKDESFWHCLRTTTLSFGIFILGLAVYSYGKHHPFRVAPSPQQQTHNEHVTLKAHGAQSDLSIVSAPSDHTRPTQFNARISHPQLGDLTMKKLFNGFYHPEDLDGSNEFRFPMMRTRRHMWRTALMDWRKHPIVGVRFGPEVPSEVAPGWKNAGGFETPYAPPVTGPHNSYLSILARTGLIGAFLFAWMLIRFFRQAWGVHHTSQPIGLFELLIFMVPLNGAIHALLNVGLESPPRAMLMWFFIGILVARYAQCRRTTCAS